MADDVRHTMFYTPPGKPFRWSAAKNELLLLERGVSFERVVQAIDTGGVLDVLRHRNPGRYPNQQLLVIAIDGYAYLVPFIENPDGYFLKTVIPSRKATRDYLKRGDDHGKA